MKIHYFILATLYALRLSFGAPSTQRVDGSLYALPVLSIQSTMLVADEVIKLSSYLGIEVGKPLNRVLIERNIKPLFGKTFDSLIVEAQVVDHGLAVNLAGSRRRILREWTFHNIETDVVIPIGTRVGIAPGQPIESRQVNSLTENIRVYLQTQGYYRSIVKILIVDVPRTNEADLEITVTRNEPGLVKKIEIIGLPEGVEGDVRTQLAVANDKPLRRADLEASVDKIGRYLRENQYPTAKVDDVHTSFSEDKHWVDITIRVKSGRRMQMQFIGNGVFDDVSLRDAITEQMMAETDSGRRIADVIERKYRDVGYHHAKVAVNDEERGATLLRRVVVDEGSKVIVDKLQIIGGETSAALIDKIFFENAPGVLGRHIFWEKGLDEAARNLEKRLVEMGYLKARVNSLKPVFSGDNLGVQLFMEIELGNRSYIDTVEITGNDSFPTADLRKVAILNSAEPYSAPQVEAARVKLLEHYQQLGFDDVQVLSEEKQLDTIETARVLVKFKVSEGVQYRVGEISIQGNVKTDPDIVLSELKMKKGDLFSPIRLKAAEENIGILGIFSKVDVSAVSNAAVPRTKDIKIAVSESRPGVGEVGMGAAYEDPIFRLRSFFGIAKRNLFGRNHTLSLRGELTVPIVNESLAPFVEFASVLGLRSPLSLVEIPSAFTASLGVDRFVQKINAVGYVTLVNRARLEERMEMKFSEHNTFFFRIHHFEKVVVVDTTPGVTPGSVETIGSIGPGIISDHRDDTFNPSKGTYHTFDLEYGSPLLLSSDSIHFIMGISRNSFYTPFVFGTHLKFYLGFGYARTLDSSNGLPAIRLGNDLALGGQNSIRGFLPRTIAAPAGTFDLAYFNARGEISFPIFGEFAGALFMDSGQLSDNMGFASQRLPDPQEFRLRHDGLGFGFRYKTPVGPFVIDFAQGLAQGNASVQFYFTLGTI